MRRRPGYAIRRQIAALDSVDDYEEARLTFEVLYGDPIAVHARSSGIGLRMEP